LEEPIEYFKTLPGNLEPLFRKYMSQKYLKEGSKIKNDKFETFIEFNGDREA
jgi:hypothetical protein